MGDFRFAKPLPPEQSDTFAPPPAPAVLRDAPWVVKPPGGIDFALQQTVTVVGPATVVIAQDAVMPQRFRGTIRELTYRVANLLATSLITFRLRINGGLVPGFTLDVFPAPLVVFSASYSDMSTFIRLPQGPATVDVQVVVGDAGTYPVSALVRGWYYDESYEHAYQSGGGML